MDLLTHLSNIPLCGRPCVRLSPVWGPQSNDNLNAKLLARAGHTPVLLGFCKATSDIKQPVGTSQRSGNYFINRIS